MNNFRTETGIHAQFGLLDDTKGSFASGKRLEAAGSNVDGSINQAAKTVCVAMASSSNAVEISRMLMTPIRL
jgi:hypothetical protein